VKAPRVLVSGVVFGQPMGGVQRHNRELLPRATRLLVERGGSLSVLAGARGLRFALPEGIEILPSRVPAGPVLARYALESAGLSRALSRATARRAPFHIVHSAHLPLTRDLAVPLTLTVHDVKDLHRAHTSLPRHLLAEGVLGSALRRAARVFAVSSALRDELLALGGVDPAKVLVLYNAGDHLRPLPRAPGKDAPLVHVGHIEKRKNLRLLVHALALDRDLPRLILAGAPSGREDVELRNLAARLGVSARVEFVGLLNDDELCALLARASCAVFPSMREGFGIPALEAQLAGVPVAVSTSAALREVTGAETPSFSPTDAAECARAIRAALATPSAALASAARRAARFSWDKSAELLVDTWCALSRARR
jgi:glycosyltransferase involved in cell wall biosynthesis